MINGKNFDDLTVKELKEICTRARCSECVFCDNENGMCSLTENVPKNWKYKEPYIEFCKKIRELFPEASEIIKYYADCFKVLDKYGTVILTIGKQFVPKGMPNTLNLDMLLGW